MNDNDWGLDLVEEKSKYTSLLALVLDSSGSMNVVRNDVIGALNAYLTMQKEAGDDMLFTLVTFSNTPRTLLHNVPIAEAPTFTEKSYVPSGSTALFDTIAHTVKEVEGELKRLKMPSLPVTLVINTDGEENASVLSHTMIDPLGYIKRLLEKKQGEGWTIVYMSADANGFQAGASYGIPVTNIFQYDPTKIYGTIMMAAAAQVNHRVTIRNGTSTNAEYFS